MILKPIVVKYIEYLSTFRRQVLEQQYGLTSLRNLLYVLPDRRLYFQDNLENEFCLTHPNYETLQDVPVDFPPEAHTHPYAADDHTHTIPSTILQTNVNSQITGLTERASIETTDAGLLETYAGVKQKFYFESLRGTHTHEALDIDSGTIGVARLPGLMGKQIATYRLSSDGTFSFQNITGSYETLAIIGQVKSNFASSYADGCSCRANNDSGSNYFNIRWQAANGTSQYFVSDSETFANLAVIEAYQSTAVDFTPIFLIIPGYSKTTIRKSFQTNPTAMRGNGAAANTVVANRYSIWKNTAAITRLDFFPANGTLFKANSKLTIYGLDGIEVM